MTEVTQRGPDPTQRTIETLHREITSVQEWAELQLKSAADISAERISSQRRVDEIREAHRIELKGDNKQTVETAMIAAEKAVQAALAAAEKARDQQTIASQLATSLAQEGSKEQMKQQAETFSTAISGLNVGFSDVKNMLGELRAEKRAGQENSTEHRANNAQMIALAAVIASILSGAFTALLVKLFGG
jgi:hypothetical protein